MKKNDLSKARQLSQVKIISDFDNYAVVESVGVKNTRLANVRYTDMFEAGDGILQAPSNNILVKPKNLDIRELLNKLDLYNMVVSLDSISDIYVIEFNSTETLDISNKIWESGLVVFSEPSFIRIIKSNNPYYDKQWGLKNPQGMDIRVEEAWRLTRGNANVKVAVLDLGVELTHLDLKANLLSGFDATGYNSGGASNSIDTHGTACAGIVAAVDNNIGIIGVAPNCKIIPIRIGIGGNNGSIITEDKQLVSSVNYAWSIGKADVLSNSWGGGSVSQSFKSEIANAVTKGRNGLGAIVTFSTGNNFTSTVNGQAADNNVIGVGAMSQSGKREGYSQYGDGLDLVAPGSYNMSTTNGNGYDYFGGTSCASPHIAGVAALILSVNPNLTGKEVRDIIESTARKVGGYSYSTTKANGTWDNEMGYGLVDAGAAVFKAMKFEISTPSIICNNSTGNFALSYLPVGSTVTWAGDSNLSLVSGQGTKTATFKSGAGNDYSTVKATIKVGTQSYDVVSSNVWVGVPETPAIGGSKQLYPNTRSTVVASSTSASTYDWNIVGDAKFYSNSGVNIVTNSSSVDIVPGDGYPGMSSMIRIRCSTANTCGTSAPGTGQFMFMGGIARMKVDSEEIYDIQVYSFPLGQLMYTEKGVINFNINDAKLSKGVYIIHKTDSEGNMTSEKVMLE